MDFSFLHISPEIARILDKALAGSKITEVEGITLLAAEGQDVWALVAVADELRRRTVGERVTYVVNRNINFTNICEANCGFCGFHRQNNDFDAYVLIPEQIGQLAAEAWNSGASEVCIQGGLHPGLATDYYLQVVREVKKQAPEIHIHAFSPMEIVYGAKRLQKSVADYLVELKEAGLGSIPGTAAEILVDEIRAKICPGKIDSATWVSVVKEAHKQGLRSTCTMLYGHVEQAHHQIRHLAILRDIQEETSGFTEFVPLSFIYPNTRLFRQEGARAGTDGISELRIHAVSRLMLNGYINNIQTSWVKLGKRMAQVCLSAGVNDFGGTLTEEKIATAAGLDSAGSMTEEQITQAIREVGRIPVRRTTLYQY